MELLRIILIALCLLAGTALIVTQIVATFTVKKAAQQTAKSLVDLAEHPDRSPGPLPDPQKVVDALKDLSSSSPLMVGGILLYVLAGLLVGLLQFAVSTAAGS